MAGGKAAAKLLIERRRAFVPKTTKFDPSLPVSLNLVKDIVVDSPNQVHGSFLQGCHRAAPLWQSQIIWPDCSAENGGKGRTLRNERDRAFRSRLSICQQSISQIGKPPGIQVKHDRGAARL